MLDNSLSADQVRCAAGVTFTEAQAATYFANAAASGWTLETLSRKTRLSPEKCRSEAFRWGVVFPDYDPFAKPVRLEWRKEPTGWALLHDGEVIGSCSITDERDRYGKQYEARCFGMLERKWDARKAMAAISEAVDWQSPTLFNGAPLKAVLTNKDGLVECVLFPVEDEAVLKCRDALQFRTIQKLGLSV